MIVYAAMYVGFVLAAGETSGNPLLDWLIQAGATGVLALAVVAFLRGWVVPGAAARREIEQAQRETELIRAERDRALELVYTQAELTQRAIDLSAEKVKS